MHEALRSEEVSSALPKEHIQIIRSILLGSALTCWFGWYMQSAEWGSKFNLWAKHWSMSAPFLCLAACVLGWHYAKEADVRAQSSYVHLAGAYFVSAAMASAFTELTIAAGHASYRTLETPSLACVLVCQAGAYGILQLMLRRRVEALKNDHSAQAGIWFWRTVGFWCAWAVMFLLRIAQITQAGYHGDATIFELFLGILSVFALVQFTTVSVLAMSEASELIHKGSQSTDLDARVGTQTLRQHAYATGVAGGASALQMTVLLISQIPDVEASESFVIVYILDSVCNLFCAYYLSGLRDRKDILGDFAIVGEAAQTAGMYGTVALPLGKLAKGQDPEV